MAAVWFLRGWKAWWCLKSDRSVERGRISKLRYWSYQSSQLFLPLASLQSLKHTQSTVDPSTGSLQHVGPARRRHRAYPKCANPQSTVKPWPRAPLTYLLCVYLSELLRYAPTTHTHTHTHIGVKLSERKELYNPPSFSGSMNYFYCNVHNL